MYFDEKAFQWDTPHVLERSAAQARLLCEHWGERDLETALEFGCGTGTVTYALGDRAARFIGYDTSENMLEVYRSKAPSERYTTVSSLAEIPAASLDVVFTSMVLHHVENVRETLATLAEKLRPGGLLSVLDLDAGSESFHHGVDVQVFHHGFAREEFAKLLQELGFTVLKFETAYEGVKVREDGTENPYRTFLITAEKGAAA